MEGPDLTKWIVPRLAALLIRALRFTMRIRCAGREPLDAWRAAGGRYIHAFWHGDLLLMPYAYAGGRIAILISEHRDGEHIARTMERFGHRSVRGSTTSGGAAALRAAVRMARDGYDLGFTPDGPRGPRHRAQIGVVAASRMTGLPIVPVGFSARPARRLGSWDGFIVPWPFSRGVFVYGEPLRVPPEARGEALERARLQVESALAECARKASEMAGDAARFRSLAPLPDPSP